MSVFAALVADALPPGRLVGIGSNAEWAEAFHARFAQYARDGLSVVDALLREHAHTHDPEQSDTHEVNFARGRLAGQLAAFVGADDLAAGLAAMGFTREEINLAAAEVNRIDGEE